MSSKRKVVFAKSEIYHVFNRSVGNLEIFTNYREQRRALDLIDYYRFPQEVKYSQYKNLPVEDKQDYLKNYKKQNPFIEIYAYALMPDHYHLLLKQLQNDGIKKFISNFQNAFAKYFNTKHNRSGSVFRNSFKAKWIGKDEIFTHVSRYIHLNPVTSFIIDIEDLPHYPLTSYPIYIGKARSDLVHTEFLLKLFASFEKYKKFVEDQADYQRKLHLIKNLVLE